MTEREVTLSIEQTKAIDFLSIDDKVTKRVIYGGQAGGGKSFLISLWQIQQRLMYPGTRGYIAREVLKDLKGSILVTFFDVAKSLDVPYKYNDVKSYIDFPNGSRIQLLEVKYRPSDPDFHDLGSTEYTDGAIEEGVAVHKRAAEILLSRTRYKHSEYGLTPKQLITCNPGDGWIKDEVVLPYINHGIEKTKNRFVPATLDSNPDKEFVKIYSDNLDSMENAYDRARLRNGDWNAMPQTGGEFYKEFEQSKHVVDAEKWVYNPEEPLHITWDENVNPYLTCTVWQIHDKKTAVQIDEICLETPRNTVEAVCKEFDRRYGTHQTGLFVYGDATSKKQDVKLEKGYNFFTLIAKHLKKYHPIVRVPSSNPAVVMRGNFMNAVFRSEFDGLKIYIASTCKKTITDYQQLKEDSDGKKKKEMFPNPETQVRYQKYGHCSDANDYFICEIFKESFTLYVKGPDKGKRVVRTIKRKNSY